MKYCHFKGDFNLIFMSNNQAITDGSCTTFTQLVIPILTPNALFTPQFCSVGNEIRKSSLLDRRDVAVDKVDKLREIKQMYVDLSIELSPDFMQLR